MQKKDITLWNVMSYSSLLDRGVVPLTDTVLTIYTSLASISSYMILVVSISSVHYLLE